MVFAHRLMFSITGAITLAVVTRPLSGWLRRRYHATPTAILMVALVCMALCLPVYLLIQHLVVQIIGLVHFVQAGGVDDFLAAVSAKHPKLGSAIQSTMAQAAPGVSGRAMASWSAPKLGMVLRGIGRGVVDLALMLFFYFFLVRDEDAAVRAWYAILPLRDSESFDLTRKLSDIISAVFGGRLLIALLQGVASGVAYWLLGVPGALLWGFVTFVCCLVPAFGAFLAWVPICLYLGLAQSWTKCIILGAWCGGVVSTMDNFLYPVFVGRKTNLHTGIIFIAIFGGLGLFGISGFILGPVLVASAIFLLQTWKLRLAETPGN